MPALRYGVLLLASLLICGCSRINQENFERIQDDMSEAEVIGILGEPTESSSYGIGPLSGTAAVWDDGKSRISIKFVNGKVKLKSFSKSTPEAGAKAG
jgi:hypothetical protein